MKQIITLFIFLFLLFSCKSPPVVIIDPLILDDIMPLPRTAVVKKIEIFEPIYSIHKISEVTEENGVQKYFLAKIGDDRVNIKSGVINDISDTATFEQIIGTYTIVDVYQDFFRAKIDTLTYKLGIDAHVRVKIGERLKELEE